MPFQNFICSLTCFSVIRKREYSFHKTLNIQFKNVYLLIKETIKLLLRFNMQFYKYVHVLLKNIEQLLENMILQIIKDMI
jgi:hypothetical protein